MTEHFATSRTFEALKSIDSKRSATNKAPKLTKKVIITVAKVKDKQPEQSNSENVVKAAAAVSAEKQVVVNENLERMRKKRKNRRKRLQFDSSVPVIEENEEEEEREEQPVSSELTTNPVVVAVDTSKSSNVLKDQSNEKELKKTKTTMDDSAEKPRSKFKKNATGGKASVTRPKRDRKNNSKENEDQDEYYEVYTVDSSPHLIHLRQKYKLYLDWLSSNQAGGGSRQHTTNQLNWYQYEISLNSRDKQYLKKCLENLNLNNHANHQNPVHHSIVSSNNNSKPVVSSSSILGYTNLRMLNSKSSMSIHTNTSSSSTVLPKLKQAPAAYKDKIYNSTPNFASYSKLPPLLHQADSLNPSPQKSYLNSTKSKGVKFSSNSEHFSNSMSYDNQSAISLNQSPTPPYTMAMNKKPILKQQQQQITSTNRALASDMSDKSGGSGDGGGGGGGVGRRSSVASTSSGSDKTSVASQRTSSMAASLLPKLPPIVRCSDDFYAVLTEFEKEKFVPTM